MSEKSLVIVESPTKAKTIRKFLPKGFVVEASMGHVRDLPQSATDIPAKLKKEEWAKLGVNVEKDFEPLYVIPKGKSKIITELRKKMKGVDQIYLATDEDREGESISWHLIQLLKPKVPVKRMVFHEITKTAIHKALEDTREIDMKLVAAQETRRVLDRLYGYTLSPLIWKKIAYGLSAGRVQSAGLRLIVERERERLEFKKASYWDLKAELEKDGRKFEAKIVNIGEKRVATGRDFDEKTGKLLPERQADTVLLSEEDSKAVLDRVKKSEWTVKNVEQKIITSRPTPPFITSTLQQEANRKLGLSARDAMRIAQTLYEQGLITYMRTDSPNLSKQAIEGARGAVTDLYGKDYLSPEPRQFSSKSKAAQEAHEAIRPAGDVFAHPKDTGLSGKELAVYDLVWKRTVATQMADAKKLAMSVKVQADDTTFSANGMKISFPGYLRAYVEGSDSPDAALEDREVILPELNFEDVLKLIDAENLPHETKPPARFTEASLVQRLEKEGIGRPSTYATILSTIIERGYARKVGNALVPSFTGLAVFQLLEKHFSDLVDYSFTSQMEEALDSIAEGTKEGTPYLRQFYSGPKGLKKLVEQKEKKIDPDESRSIHVVPTPPEVKIQVGRFGPYVVKSTGDKKADAVHASIPEDIAPADLTSEMIDEIVTNAEEGPKPIGKHPEGGGFIYCLLGRYGPYLQLGEVTEENPKPRRASVPKDIPYREITMAQAVKLLSLPRVLGTHPETKETVTANIGRFGPYIVHQDDFRSLKKDDNVYEIEIARALEILAEPKKGRRGAAKPIREMGKHPETGKEISVFDGKYGPYFKHGAKNYSLPKDTTAEDLTMDKVIELMSAKEGGGKGKKKGAKKKATKKKAADSPSEEMSESA